MLDLSRWKSSPGASAGTVSPDQHESGDSWVSAAACMAAASTLGVALQITDGSMHPDALTGVGYTLALGALAVLMPRIARFRGLAERALLAGVVVALAWQLKNLFSREVAQNLQLQLIPSTWPYARFNLSASLAVLFTGLGLGSPRHVRRWLVPMLLASYASMGLWLMATSPAPRIDVWVFQDEAARTLLGGKNPYAVDFPDIHNNASWYGPGMMQNGRLMFGFPYPPVSLYCATLGYLFGDPRYAQLFCMLLAGALMAYGHLTRLAIGAAALFLLTPRCMVVLELAWTEPILVGLLALTVFCALRFPRAVPYALGVLLVAKQYNIFLVPLIPLLTPLRGRALLFFLLRAGATGLLLTLPFLVLNFEAFWWSVVKLQFYQPFRMESLSYLPWWVSRGHPQPPLWVPFAFTGVALVLSVWRAPRTPAGFAAAVGFVYCTFFAFNKQAFVNYYYFVVGAFCIAVAAYRTHEPDEPALTRAAVADAPV